MKKARNILWLLFPVMIILQVVLSYAHVIRSFIVADIFVSLVFMLPITAMLLQTIMNREKNLDNSMYIVKLTFVGLLYLMVLFMFAFTLLGGRI